MISVLFVCHGNICRSPMAEFIFKDMVSKRGLADQFYIASAATSTEEIWNGIGNPVYPPAREELARHGISCKGKRAVQLTKADYESEIQAGKDDIAEIQNNNLYSDDDKEVMIQERQSNIDECQAKYETAPEAINYTGSPSDNQIHSISELVSNNPSN